MTYRIEIKRGANETVFVFCGLLDESALVDLAARLEESPSAQLVLARGAEVTPTAMASLRALSVTVRAESPFLAAWLRSPSDVKA